MSKNEDYMIRKAEKSEKSELLALWRECFDDEFADAYFDGFFSPENCVLLERDGRIAAALHYRVESLCVPGCGELTVGYLYRIGVRADSRGGGLGRELLRGAFKALRDEGAAAAIVVPKTEKLFDFYAKLGFSEMFLIEKSPVRRAAIAPREEVAFELPPERAAECDSIYRAVVRWRAHESRSDERWRAAAAATYAAGGSVLALERGGALAGYAFCRTAPAPRIDELFCEDEEAFDALRLAALDFCGVDALEFRAPACPHGAERFALIRALDGAKLLEFGLKRRPGDLAIEVDDPDLPENSKRYTAENGSVTTSERRGSGITPGQFAATILGGGAAPYINLVL